MFHAEFIGLPGTGKSMLHKSLINGLQQKGYPCLSAEQALVSALKNRTDDFITRLFLMLLPDKTAILHASTILNMYRHNIILQAGFLAERGGALKIFLESKSYRDMTFDERTMVISRFLKAASSFQIIQQETEDDQAVIFDSGFIQKAMGFFISPKSDSNRMFNDDVIHYLENIPLPDLLLFAESKPETCHKRLTTRSRGLTHRLDGMDENQILSFLLECHDFFSQVTKYLDNRGVTVIRVSNDGPFEEAISQLIALSRKFFFEK